MLKSVSPTLVDMFPMVASAERNLRSALFLVPIAVVARDFFGFYDVTSQVGVLIFEDSH